MGQATLLIVLGVLLIAAFGYLNFVVQPKMFPGEVAGGSAPTKGAAKPSSSVHMFLGIAEAAVFMAGVALIVVGSTMITTIRGYG